MRGRRPQRWRSRGGFSLTETVILISIIGILGVTAAPRFMDVSATDTRFFHRTTIAALRYARKLAIASHCPVEFDFTVDGFAIQQRTGCTSGAYGQPVFDPAGGSTSYTGSAPQGVTLTSSIDPLYFDALGRVLDSGGLVTDVSISVGGLEISALGESGFIHAP